MRRDRIVRTPVDLEVDRIRAVEDGCTRIVKRGGRWWIVSPRGLARPTSSWRFAVKIARW